MPRSSPGWPSPVPRPDHARPPNPHTPSFSRQPGIRRAATKCDKPVALASVSYNSSTDTVTLLAKSKLNLAKPEELRITASQLPDVYGRPLDGNDDGQPGGDFVALLTKSGVKIESIATPSTLTAKAVDALLSAGKLEEISAHFRRHKAM